MRVARWPKRSWSCSGSGASVPGRGPTIHSISSSRPIRLVPRVDLGQRVGRHDQHQLVVGMEPLQLEDAVERVRRAGPLHLEAAQCEERVALNGKARQEHAIRGSGDQPSTLVWRLGGGHEQDAVEPHGVGGRRGQPQVADVRRIERPSEDADACAGRLRRLADRAALRCGPRRHQQGRTQSSSPHSSSIGPMWTVAPASAPARRSSASMPRRSS